MKQKAMLAPDVILRILINWNDDVKKLLEPNSKITLVITSFGLYEALMCIEETDEVEWGNLFLLMNVSEFVFSEGIEMSEDRRKHLRKIALEDDGVEGKQ